MLKKINFIWTKEAWRSQTIISMLKLTPIRFTLIHRIRNDILIFFDSLSISFFLSSDTYERASGNEYQQMLDGRRWEHVRHFFQVSHLYFFLYVFLYMRIRCFETVSMELFLSVCIKLPLKKHRSVQSCEIRFDKYKSSCGLIILIGSLGRKVIASINKLLVKEIKWKRKKLIWIGFTSILLSFVINIKLQKKIYLLRWLY